MWWRSWVVLFICAQYLISFLFVNVITDVDDVKFVINYDFPSNIEDYVHRIGRTGRSNNKGTSYTFFTQSNGAKVDELVNILQETNQVRILLIDVNKQETYSYFPPAVRQPRTVRA